MPKGQPETERGRGKTLHIDHDHATNKIRGVLCHNCNRVLGYVKDDPAILRGLIAYLERTH